MNRKQWLKHLEVDKYLATVEILLLSCKERKSVACRVKVAVDCRSPSSYGAKKTLGNKSDVLTISISRSFQTKKLTSKAYFLTFANMLKIVSRMPPD